MLHGERETMDTATIPHEQTPYNPSDCHIKTNIINVSLQKTSRVDNPLSNSSGKGEQYQAEIYQSSANLQGLKLNLGSLSYVACARKTLVMFAYLPNVMQRMIRIQT